MDNSNDLDVHSVFALPKDYGNLNVTVIAKQASNYYVVTYLYVAHRKVEINLPFSTVNLAIFIFCDCSNTKHLKIASISYKVVKTRFNFLVTVVISVVVDRDLTIYKNYVITQIGFLSGYRFDSNDYVPKVCTIFISSI